MGSGVGLGSFKPGVGGGVLVAFIGCCVGAEVAGIEVTVGLERITVGIAVGVAVGHEPKHAKVGAGPEGLVVPVGARGNGSEPVSSEAEKSAVQKVLVRPIPIVLCVALNMAVLCRSDAFQALNTVWATDEPLARISSACFVISTPQSVSRGDTSLPKESM